MKNQATQRTSRTNKVNNKNGNQDFVKFMDAVIDGKIQFHR